MTLLLFYKFNNFFIKFIFAGKNFEDVIKRTDELVKQKVVGISTRILMLAPFFYSIYKMPYEEHDSIIKSLVDDVSKKVKEWKMRFPHMKIIWMIPYNISPKDSDYGNYTTLVRKLKVSMELVETAIFNLDSFLDVALCQNGYTLNAKCKNLLTDQIQNLVTSMNVKGIIPMRKNGKFISIS